MGAVSVMEGLLMGRDGGVSGDRARLVALALGEDLRDVAGWLAHYEQLRAAVRAPGSVRQPRGSAKLSSYVRALTTAFRDQEAERLRTAGCAVAPRPVGAIALLPASSAPQETITVAAAADLLGCTRQHVRRLAGSGHIRGHLGDRAVWHLNRHSVIAYRDRLRGQHDDDGHLAGPSAGSAGRGPAA